MVKFSDLLVDKSLHMMSFCRQFGFHDVIYHIQPSNVDYRRRNVVFTSNGLFKTYVKIPISVQTRVAGNSNTVQDGRIMID